MTGALGSSIIFSNYSFSEQLLPKATNVNQSSSGSGSNSRTNSSDLLLAQELERRERQRQKFEEQKQFDQLRAQYGMDDDGNYRQQTMANMQKAVYKGQMSVTDYYERQVKAVIKNRGVNRLTMESR